MMSGYQRRLNLDSIALLIIAIIIVVQATPETNVNNRQRKSVSSTTARWVYDDDDPASLPDTSDTTGSVTADQFPVLDPAGINLPADATVLEFEIGPRYRQQAPELVEFGKAVFVDLHRCLCNNNTVACEIDLDGSTAESVNRVSFGQTKQTMQDPTQKFLCSKVDNSLIECNRLSASDYLNQCQDNVAMCSPQASVLGGSCQKGPVDIFWNSVQVLDIVYIHISLISSFVCYSRCFDTGGGGGDVTSSTTLRPTTTTDDEDDGDERVSPTIIGVIVGCVVVVIIVVTVFTMWAMKQKRQAKENAHRSSAARSTSFDGVDHGRVGEFQKKQSNSDLGALGGPNGVRLNPSAPPLASTRSGVVGYSNPPAGSNINNNNNVNKSNKNSRDGSNANTNPYSQEEFTYASIEETYSHQYTPLDDALKYNHQYNELQPPVQDPKLRPRLPLPNQATNGPLPYYSTAYPPDGVPSNANTGDIVSGQYVELIDEQPSAGPSVSNHEYLQPGIPLSHTASNSGEQPGSAQKPLANDSSDTVPASPANQNNYFELERVDSLEESSFEAYSPDVQNSNAPRSTQDGERFHYEDVANNPNSTAGGESNVQNNANS